MFDPYQNDTPGVSDPANNALLLTPDDVNDLAVGLKAWRIFNPTTGIGTIRVTTVAGNDITLSVPASCLWVESLRIKRLWATGTTGSLIIHGYTDVAIP